jgi:hypothetical protein
VAANLREVHCGLIALDTARARTLGARISASLEAQQPGELEGLLREAGEVLEAERREMAAAARRRAVLNGLAALGYEVREAMAVAWPKEGRIVMRKPGVADYGLELGAPADAARVQMRLVGSDRPVVPRHAERDRNMETVWCADFQKLREQVALSGAEVIIERALEAGAQPVKTVSMEPQQRSEDTAADKVVSRRTLT